MKQRILIGTDLILAYLLNTDYYEGIAVMFNWMRQMGVQKMTDHGTLAILTHFVKTDVLKRLNGFDVVGVIPKMSPFYRQLSSQNLYRGDERALLVQLNLIEQGYADLLITENRLTYELAKRRNIDDRLYSIEEFIETCAIEHRDLDEMRGIGLQVVPFGSLTLSDKFFRSFINEYHPYYFEWFKKKKNDPVFVVKDDNGNIHALLKLKIETEVEQYDDIAPIFPRARRLKISSLKVDYTGQKIGERFIRIIFDQALDEKVDEIYVTIFTNSAQRKRLVDMIQKWGFVFWGLKNNREEVYVRNMRKHVLRTWMTCYPFSYRYSHAYILPVGRTFSNMLIASQEERQQQQDYEPYRHAIRKMVVIESGEEKLRIGCNLLFYTKGNGVLDGRVVASGVVDEIYDKFENEKQFLNRCKKRSILSFNDLHDYWVRCHGNPVVIYFLHNGSFGGEYPGNCIENIGIQQSRLMNMKPVRLTQQQYDVLIKGTKFEEDIVVG